METGWRTRVDMRLINAAYYVWTAVIFAVNLD